MRDHTAIAARDVIGVESLMWGNDFPHHDSIWPRSQEILREIMAGVPDDERDAMVWKNVQQLYAIDESKLPVGAAV